MMIRVGATGEVQHIAFVPTIRVYPWDGLRPNLENSPVAAPDSTRVMHWAAWILPRYPEAYYPDAANCRVLCVI